MASWKIQSRFDHGPHTNLITHTQAHPTGGYILSEAGTELEKRFVLEKLR